MILILFLIINHLYLFFLISLARGLSILSIFFRERPVISTISSIGFAFSFIYFCSDLYYFFSSAHFGFNSLFDVSAPAY